MTAEVVYQAGDEVGSNKNCISAVHAGLVFRIDGSKEFLEEAVVDERAL